MAVMIVSSSRRSVVLLSRSARFSLNSFKAVAESSAAVIMSNNSLASLAELVLILTAGEFFLGVDDDFILVLVLVMMEIMAASTAQKIDVNRQIVVGAPHRSA